MNPTDIATYQSTLATLISTPATQPNLTTIQGLVTTLESNRATVLGEQSSSTLTSLTDTQDYAVSMIRATNFNKTLEFAMLASCYYDYNNQIAAAAGNPTLQASLVTDMQNYQATLLAQIQADPFGIYLYNLIQFCSQN